MNLKNLPPGVSDNDIEKQARSADHEAAIETIFELANEYELDSVEIVQAFGIGATIINAIRAMTDRKFAEKKEEEEDLELL